MNLHPILNKAIFQLKKNSPVLFATAASAGVIATAYLSGKAAIVVDSKIKQRENFGGTREDLVERWKERIPYIWKDVTPPIIVGSGTIFCIVAATRVGLARATAAQAALLVVEKAYDGYREEVIKEYGEQKDKELRARVAEQRTGENPPPQVVMLGEGSVMACDLQSMRYFMASMETLRKAENDLNFELIRNDTASLTDFYLLLGVDPTRDSDSLGWYADKQMELQISPIMGPNNTPCLAFDFNYIRPLYERWEQ